MNKLFQSLTPARKYIFEDKINILLVLIPILIGVTLYLLFGSWLFGTIATGVKGLVMGWISSDVLGDIVFYIVTALLSIALFLLINWTFVLIVSIFASPFYDMLSQRIEKRMLGDQLESADQAWSQMFKKIPQIIWNEIKKVSFILFFSVLAFVLSYLIPPVGFFITALLLSVQFIDYTWSRHDLPSSECYKDVKANLLPYGLMGALLFILLSVPLLNLIVPAYATSFFTVYWNQEKKEINNG